MAIKNIKGKIENVSSYKGSHDRHTGWTLISVKSVEGESLNLSLRENYNKIPGVKVGVPIRVSYESELPLFGPLSNFHEITRYCLYPKS